VRVIIDTDPGVDDAQAIAFAVQSGGFDVEAITTVFGNCAVHHGTRNARHLLDIIGRLDIPVFQGAAGPLVRRRLPNAGAALVHGKTGTGAIRLPRPPTSARVAGGRAAIQLADRVIAEPGQLTVLALGPLTNIALAMRLEPSFIDSVAGIVWMGGIIRGPGNVGPVTTANVLNDVEAAAIVFSESRGKLTMVGQDVTRHVRIDPERFERIRRSGPLGRYLHEIARFYRDAYLDLEPDLPGFPVHDLLVPAYALRPDLFVTEWLPVRIETAGEMTTGMTVADLRPTTRAAANVTVCVGARGDDILGWYIEVLEAASGE
jgi:inosine-uridine nucleoside N-ribohydrolase